MAPSGSIREIWEQDQIKKSKQASSDMKLHDFESKTLSLFTH